MSRIPRRCANNNKNKDETTSSPSNTSYKNNAKDNDVNRSPSLEKSVNLNVPDSNETIPTTPGCIAARIRSYSALRRSQCKRKTNNCSTDSNKENACCSPPKTMSPLEETGCGPEVVNNSDLSSESESDEDILWKMSRRNFNQEEDMAHAKVSEIRKTVIHK